MTTDLQLTDYERGYLTAYYDTVVFDAMADSCDEDWFGVQIGDRMFDLNAWADEDTGKFVCVVYDCIWVNDNWQTNSVQNGWVLTDEASE